MTIDFDLLSSLSYLEINIVDVTESHIDLLHKPG